MQARSDTLGRRARVCAQPTGKRVSPTERDLVWLRKLAEHGPLPTSFLLAFARGSHASQKRASERLTDLFHEDNTPDGGPYLVRPPQQFRTLDSRYNQLVYDIGPAGWRALDRNGMDGKQSAPSGPWLHRFMTSCITASVDLATHARGDLSYIPQSAILLRVGAELRCPVRVLDPVSGSRAKKDLIPDALFGLAYHTKEGDRFRFFAVEADRATEPLASGNWNRKSAVRNFQQYVDYVANGIYREHLCLTAPLLVLNVTTDLRRAAKLQALIARLCPQGNSYMLFQAWDEFSPVFRPPLPNDHLIDGEWLRAGLPSLVIGRP